MKKIDRRARTIIELDYLDEHNELPFKTEHVYMFIMSDCEFWMRRRSLSNDVNLWILAFDKSVYDGRYEKMYHEILERVSLLNK